MGEPRSTASGKALALFGVVLFILGVIIALAAASSAPNDASPPAGVVFGLLLLLFSMVPIFGGAALVQSASRHNLELCLPGALASGETVLYKSLGFRVSPEPRAGGFLVLTPQRLFFMRATADKRTYELESGASWRLQDVHEVRLDAPRQIGDGGGARYGGGGGYAFGDLVVAGVRFRVKHARDFESALNNARRVAAGSASPMPSAPQPPVSREVIREIVKMPCRYCGHLILNTANRCDACNAPVRS